MFLTVYSWLMLLFDMIGLYMIFAYFKMGQAVALNIEISYFA